MDKQHLKKISDGLLKTFIDAGEKSIKLREIGLKKEIKYFDEILRRNFNKLFNTKLKLRKTLE